MAREPANKCGTEQNRYDNKARQGQSRQEMLWSGMRSLILIPGGWRSSLGDVILAGHAFSYTRVECLPKVKLETVIGDMECENGIETIYHRARTGREKRWHDICFLYEKCCPHSQA